MPLTSARAATLLALRGLRRHRYATRAEVAAYQDSCVRRLVRHAYRSVPYYRRLLDGAGIRADDVRRTADLVHIPISSKADLRAVPAEDLVARGTNPSSLITSSTSGSSGEPFAIRRTWLEQNLLHLYRLRALRAVGVRLTDLKASIVYLRSAHHRDSKLFGRALTSLGLLRNERLDLFSPPDAVVARLRALSPDVVSGFPGVLARLASAMGTADREAIRPRLVLSGAEVLTPMMRDRISAAFGAPVFDLYGSHEFNLLAWECRENGEMHCCDDAIVLDVVRDGVSVPAGDSGEVVGTALHSYAMPLIRFKLGDLVTRGDTQCACGQPWSTIRSIQGRVVGHFPLPGGRVAHPFGIVRHLVGGDRSWVAQYQLLQERIDRIVLSIVPTEWPSSAQLAALDATMRAELGSEVDVCVSLVSEIPLEPNGKFRAYRSLVQSDYDGPGQVAAVGASASVEQAAPVGR